MELRTRPENYLESAAWRELHVLTSHWQSDMAFFADELRFIDLLFDKYFNALIDPENIGTTKAVASKLSTLKNDREILSSRLAEHLHHIKELMTTSPPQSAANVREEHASLEEGLTDFIKRFRVVKREIFELTERIARTEKARHLIAK
jgi:hypothetical protein